MKPERRAEIGQQSTPQRRRWRRRRGAPTPPPTGLLFVASIGRYVPVIDGLERADTRRLLGEDVCWQFSRADWRSRRPRIWRRAARIAWLAEGEELDAKRARLVEQTVGARTLRAD